MISVNKHATISDYNPNNYAVPKFPNDVSSLILKRLENLMDIESFAASSHTVLKLTQVIWFDKAKHLG